MEPYRKDTQKSFVVFQARIYGGEEGFMFWSPQAAAYRSRTRVIEGSR